MELKHLRLLALSLLFIPSASAFSLSDVVGQILAYPQSLFQPSDDLRTQPQDNTLYSSKSPKIALTPATFPCCNCIGCICSHTSCPHITRRPGESSQANWPIESGTPKNIAAAGCGEGYGLDACLTFVQQYLQALQPALETASNHSHEYAGDFERGERRREEEEEEEEATMLWGRVYGHAVSGLPSDDAEGFAGAN